MQPDVSNIVSAKHHSWTQLALHAYVHLNRPWRFVIRVEETCSRKVYSPVLQVGRQENPVRPHRIGREGSLESSLESRGTVGKDLSCASAAARPNGASDRCVADYVCGGLGSAEEVCRPVSEPHYTPGPHASSSATITRILSRVELAGCKLQLPVKQNVIEHDIVIKNPNSASDHRLAITLGIPCKPCLRREVSVGLPNRISRPWDDIVDCRKRDVAIGAASIPVIPEAITQGEVWLYLPTVTNIGADSVIWTQAAGRFSKALQFGERPFAISHRHRVGGVVQGASGAGLATRTRKGPWGKQETRHILWRYSEEAGKRPARNSVIIHPPPDDV